MWDDQWLNEPCCRSRSTGKDIPVVCISLSTIILLFPVCSETKFLFPQCWVYLNKCSQCYTNYLSVRPLCFFLCFRWARALDLGRALPKKTCVFFLPSARIRLLPISEKKQLISGVKKSKKQVYFKRYIKHFQAILIVFFVALINLF